MSGRLLLRPGVPDDLTALASLHLRSRAAAGTSMPPSVHDDAAVRRYLAATDLVAHDLWLAEEEGLLRGYVLLSGDWLDSLYVDPEHQREGVGRALVGLVQGLRPLGFGLWVFVQNAPARAFYRAHGLVEVETTDGAGNEERAPDVALEWRGA